MTKDDLRLVIAALEMAQHAMQPDMAVYIIDNALLKCENALSLMALNDVPTDWNDSMYRQR